MDECALYTDPLLYDCLFGNAGGSATVTDQRHGELTIASESFYIEQALEGGGRVLELGFGTGRLTIPIAQRGVDIVGADLSPTMLQRARAKATAAGLAVEFVPADMRRFDFGTRFSTILIPGNSLLHLLTIEDLRQCFACVRRHLAPGGKLAFDVSKWDLARLTREPGERHFVLRVTHPERGEITVEETAEYDAAEQVRRIAWYLSTPGKPDFQIVEYRLRVVFPQELIWSDLVKLSGARFWFFVFGAPASHVPAGAARRDNHLAGTARSRQGRAVVWRGEANP
jgi:SAM-dependent methyltransferase